MYNRVHVPYCTTSPMTTSVKTSINITNTAEITLSNGVVIYKPLNLHAAWAKAGNVKLGLGMLGIGLVDIITTLCLRDISSVCPGYVMPEVSMPKDILALDVSIDVLKAAYAKYAEIYCNIPMVDWKVIKEETSKYLDMSTF